jgi:hypothetical protein
MNSIPNSLAYHDVVKNKTNGIKNTERKNIEKLEDAICRLCIVELCSIGAYRYFIIFLVTVHCLRQSV